MEKVVVQRSPIHGQGVFAAQRIEAGEVIIDGFFPSGRGRSERLDVTRRFLRVSVDGLTIRCGF